ncbi:MAG: DUF421 domain-containing protein [Oscillospiraceae bacterium]|nr:DUF421 domain-containing protein [Oscillospiraceae bacterium]
MTISFIRTVILYLLISIALRAMGKRQVGELSSAELVITLLFSELAAIPMESTDIPLLYGVVPILTLLALEILVSSLFLKSRWIRKIAVGRTSIIIENGKINQLEMKKLRLTLDELFEELRLKSIIDISTVKYAILESNGELSVFQFGKDMPATRQDLKLNDDNTYLPRVIISDGVVIESELKNAGIGKSKIEKELKKHGITSPRDVFLMQADERGELLIIPKENTK